MSSQLRTHWRVLAISIIIVIGIGTFFFAESQPTCFGICGGTEARGVFTNSANCSSSLGRCDLMLVNGYIPSLNTTGTGTITFNNQTGYLLCAVVELKPNVNTKDSCMLQGIASPHVGTHFDGEVAIANGAAAAFMGNFTA
jgi:hypothetical protein